MEDLCVGYRAFIAFGSRGSGVIRRNFVELHGLQLDSSLTGWGLEI